MKKIITILAAALLCWPLFSQDWAPDHFFAIPEEMEKDDIVGDVITWYHLDLDQNLVTYSIEVNQKEWVKFEPEPQSGPKGSYVDLYKIDPQTGRITYIHTGDVPHVEYDSDMEKRDKIHVIKIGVHYEGKTDVITATIRVKPKELCVFVDPNPDVGNDNNQGNRANPLLTFPSKGSTSRSIEANKGYFLKRGGIIQDNQIQVETSGSELSPIIFASYGNAVVKGDGNVVVKGEMSATTASHNELSCGIRFGDWTNLIQVEHCQVYDIIFKRWGHSGIQGNKLNKHIKVFNCDFNRNGLHSYAHKGQDSKNADGSIQKGQQSPGLYFYGLEENSIEQNLLVQNCKSSDNTEHGFKYEGVVRGEIINCLAYGNGINAIADWPIGGHGFQMAQSSKGNYKGLEAYGNKSHGLAIRDNNSMFSDIRTYSNLKGGIYVWEDASEHPFQVNDVIIENAWVFENTRAGIRIEYTPSNIHFKRLRVFNNKREGLLISDGVVQNVTVEYSEFRNNSTGDGYNEGILMRLSSSGSALNVHNVSFFENGVNDIKVVGNSDVKITNTIYTKFEGNYVPSNNYNFADNHPYQNPQQGNLKLLENHPASNTGQVIPGVDYTDKRDLAGNLLDPDNGLSMGAYDMASAIELLAHWKFEGDGVDATGNGNDMIIDAENNGVIYFDKHPKLGYQALGFFDHPYQGISPVEMGSFENTAALTFSFWADIRNQGAAQLLKTTTPDGINVFQFSIIRENEIQYMEFSKSGDPAFKPIKFPVNLTSQRFNHFLITLNTQTQLGDVELNGVSLGSFNLDGQGLLKQVLRYYIGGTELGNDIAIFDDLRVYNGLLTSPEKDQLYQFDAPTDPNNLNIELNAKQEPVLTWADNSNNETEFVVTKTDATFAMYIDDYFVLPAGTTSYTDAGFSLPENQNIYYSVYAKNGEIASDGIAVFTANTIVIQPSPNGYTTPVAGTHVSNEGEAFIIYATPNPGLAFSSFTVDGQEVLTNPMTATVGTHRSIQANFVPVESVTRTVQFTMGQVGFNSTDGTHWNLRGVADADLKDTEGNLTGIGISLWSGKAGSKGVDGSCFPQLASKYYYYLDNSVDAQGNLTNDNMPLTISGLDVNKTYNIKFLSSTTTQPPQYTEFMVQGNTKAIMSSENSCNLVEFNSLLPESNGEIQAIVKRQNGSTYGYLNAVIIEEMTGGGNSNPNPDPEPLIAHWKFDNDGGADASGHSKNLSLPGDVTFSSPGEVGTHSLSLNGSNFGSTSSAVNLGSNFSISLWVNIPYSSAYNCQTLIANAISGANGDGFRLYVNSYSQDILQQRDGVIRFDASNGSTSNHMITGEGAFLFDQWNHLVVTVDVAAGTGAIYMNGAVLSTDGDVHSQFKTNDVIYVGSMANSTFKMNGMLDDIKIYPKTLTAQEVSSIYAAPKASKAVAAPSSLSAISHYPNPVNDFLALKGVPVNSHLKLFNAMGKLVQSTVCKDQDYMELETLALPNGLYYLIMISPKGDKESIQFLKQ